VPVYVTVAPSIYPEALKLVDDEGWALVRTEFADWLVPKRQRELSIWVIDPALLAGQN
jgi:hypothetical protein